MEDLTLQCEKQVAFAALDQKKTGDSPFFALFDDGATRFLLRTSRPLYLFSVASVVSLPQAVNYFFCFSAFVSASSKIASTGFVSVHSTRPSMSR